MKYRLDFYLEDDVPGTDTFISIASDYLPSVGDKVFITDEMLAEQKDARHPNGYRVVDRRFLIGVDQEDEAPDAIGVFEVIVEPT